MQETFFHYTGIGALHGILRSQAFWLTSSNNTNDPMELRHAERAVTQALRTIAEKGDPLIVKYAESLLSERKEHPYDPSRPGTEYFICFSARADSLNHWRYYSADQTGVAVACNMKNVDEAFEKLGFERRNRPISHFDLIYHESDVLRKIEDKLWDYWDGYEGYTNSFFGPMVESMATMIKGKLFYEESEHRMSLVHDGDYATGGMRYGDDSKLNAADKRLFGYCQDLGLLRPGLQFYHNGRALRPYYEFRLGVLARLAEVPLSDFIPEIVLGRQCSQNLQDLRVILDATGMAQTRITRAQDPAEE